MPDANDPYRGEDQANIQALSSLAKAYVDQQIENAIEQYDASQTKIKRFRNSWRSASPITKGSFVMTAGIALATIIYAFIAWRTLRAMRSIADDNSKQTYQMIEAANEIKHAGWTFSGAAIGTNNAVWGAVGKLNAQAKATSAVAGAAGKQATQALVQATATQKLVETQRPWLAVSVKLTKFNWGEHPNGIGRPAIVTLNSQYQITVENFGNLPASKVYVIYDETPIPESVNGNWWWNTLMKEQEDYCAAKIAAGNLIRQTWPGGVTVFPRQQHTFEETRAPEERTQAEWEADGRGILRRYIRGCVVYQSPTNKGMRQTGFFYTLRHVDYEGAPYPIYKTGIDNITLLDQSGETKSD